jgi:hypothetical protein
LSQPQQLQVKATKVVPAFALLQTTQTHTLLVAVVVQADLALMVLT